MMTLEGTHGTTVTRYRQIAETGFQMPDRPGRGGTGVYFWKSSLHSNELAQGWYNQCYSEGRYRRDENQNGVIIFASMTLDETEFFNLEDDDTKVKVYKLAQAKGVNTGGRLAALYDFFIKTVEEKANVAFKVIGKAINPPKPEFLPTYNTMILGFPYCYIVKDIDLISIKNKEWC
ncbi:hypothetical protein [Pseudodesulfovibrio senegalensis]|uniref:RES family NAD+ phosphorylase n=1 Tax=Pseudodesulfovibrio senegalensis TaxID=1721087 RepID=A0A6N6N6C1_9BACT|nr:hypothetical protein [Pseudodesulfovibrio senegalensis]KAB1443576.1 hypothetical protein F8A88_04845 [Pseudodesulfovibrio senegalensis]